MVASTLIAVVAALEAVVTDSTAVELGDVVPAELVESEIAVVAAAAAAAPRA